MGQRLFPCFKSLLIIAVFATALPLAAHSQAAPTATRSSAIDIYGAGSISQTDYNSTDKGFLIGGDFTYHLRHFDTSLDVRYNRNTGDAVGEKTFDGGIKISRPFARYHPYAQFLLGYGVVTFDHPVTNPDGTLYSYDNSTVYDFGGGVDVDLTHSFALKLDGQYQYWNLGARGDANAVHLNPSVLSFGIIYHLPYRFLRPRRY